MRVTVPRNPGTVAGVAMAVFLALRIPRAHCRDAPKNFVYQFKGMCYFTNGTERVRLVARQIYNKEEILHFDSDLGKFVAVTELGRVCAETWNTQKDLLAEFRAYVETLCRHNYKETASFTVQRRVEPTVTVSPASTEAPNHHNLLVCSVTNFYPRQVKVKWFRNQQEETAGVGFTPLTQNGDWTYQIHVMLETIPQLGDVYVCRVDHPSLQSPVTVEWRKGRFIDPMDSTGKEKFRECAASGGVGSVFIPRVLRNSLTQILGWR